MKRLVGRTYDEGYMDYRVYYMRLTIIVASTGILSILFGYRETAMLMVVVYTVVIGGFLYHRKREKPHAKMKPRKILHLFTVLVAVFFGLLSIFIATDHIRATTLVAIIQKETDGYTTINRCTLSGVEQHCLHETKGKVEIYNIKKGKVTEVLDMTEYVRGSTEGKG